VEGAARLSLFRPSPIRPRGVKRYAEVEAIVTEDEEEEEGAVHEGRRVRVASPASPATPPHVCDPSPSRCESLKCAEVRAMAREEAEAAAGVAEAYRLRLYARERERAEGSSQGSSEDGQLSDTGVTFA